MARGKGVEPLYRERRHRPRMCDHCGQSYHRRNLVEAWTSQNAGHRVGWGKATLRLCTRCQGATEATKTLIMAEANIIRDGHTPKASKPKASNGKGDAP